MHVVADLQLHSRFARAVSKQMTLPYVAQWARRKGIGVVATGDWTHPLWFREIERDLEEMGNGLLRLKNAAPEVSEAFFASPPSPSAFSPSAEPKKGVAVLENAHLPGAANSSPLASGPLFLLATEVSSIYSQGGRLRRVHTLIWVPTLESARKINSEFTRRGCNLMSDGRPIIGLSSIHVAELVLSIEPKALIIPAHAWTPWFSVYGSLGGFDSLEEAFGPFAKNIYAIETGLSSNPSMNWRIKELDNRAILSFSDAHSGPKLGREATVFEVPDGEVSYDAIYEAITGSSGKSKEQRAKVNIAYTLEFYPEEGKYHYTGHRTCGICWSPQETKQKGKTCPVCGKPLTVGVMHRVEDLAGRSEEDLKLESITIDGLLVKGIRSKTFPSRPPFAMLVPLQEIISEAIGSPVTSPKVQTPYFRLTGELGGEFSVLLSIELSEIARVAGARVAQGIDRVRHGNITIDPGYDGVFGTVKIWKEGESIVDTSKEQLAMFSQ